MYHDSQWCCQVRLAVSTKHYPSRIPFFFLFNAAFVASRALRRDFLLPCSLALVYSAAFPDVCLFLFLYFILFSKNVSGKHVQPIFVGIRGHSFTASDVYQLLFSIFSPENKNPAHHVSSHISPFCALHSIPPRGVQIYASKLKLHPVVVIGVLYVAEHLVGVQGLIIAVPCAVFVINNMILGSNGDTDDDGSTAVAPA